MAVTGIVLLGFVLAHMIGNLKVFLGKEHINLYGESLRDLGEPLLPRTVLLWSMRIVLIAAFVAPHPRGVPAHADEPQGAARRTYQSKRDYVAANFASRTMRWTGDHRRPVPDLPPRSTSPGEREPRLRARRSVQQPVQQLRARARRDRLHRRHARARRSTSSTAPGRCSRASGSTTRATTSGAAAFAVGFAVVIIVGNVSIPLLHHRPGVVQPDDRRTLDADGSPPVPIAEKWDQHKFDVKLVNPANKRRFEIIVVGTGLAGASAAATLGELGYKVKVVHLPRLAPPRALHRRAGRHQRGEELPERRRQRLPPLLRHDEGRRLPRPRGATSTGSPR